MALVLYSYIFVVSLHSNLSDLAQLTGVSGQDVPGDGKADSALVETYERKIQRLEKEKKELQKKVHGKGAETVVGGSIWNLLKYLTTRDQNSQ